MKNRFFFPGAILALSVLIIGLGIIYFSPSALGRAVWDPGDNVGRCGDNVCFSGTENCGNCRTDCGSCFTPPPSLPPSQPPSQPSPSTPPSGAPQADCSEEEKGNDRCSGAQIQTCNKPVSGGYNWSPPRDCGANLQCQQISPDKAQCAPPPGQSIGPELTGTKNCFRATIGYGAGQGGNPYFIFTGENTPFYIHWNTSDWQSANCGDSSLRNYITSCSGWGTKWQGRPLNQAGDSERFAFSGQADANYNNGVHNFQVACNVALPNGTVQRIFSNIVSAWYLYNPPQPPSTCRGTNECSPNQCWNLFQTRPCVLDNSTGCYKWSDPVGNCIGGRCENGVCIGGGSGQQPGQPGQPGTGQPPDGQPQEPDVCPNISGLQTSVPSGYIMDPGGSGNCIRVPGEKHAVCSNNACVLRDGAGQNQCRTDPDCVVPDACPNIPGAQDSIPPGFVKELTGNCVPRPVPSADLKANGSDGPITVNQGQSAELSWTSGNVTSCAATGDWNGSRGVEGRESTGPLSNTRGYTLTCSGSWGSISDSVTVRVSGDPNPAPTVDLKINGTDGPAAINYNDSATLSWTSGDTDYCTASAGSWSGRKDTSGSQSTGALVTNTSYSLTCYGSGGVATDSVVANVRGGPPPPPPCPNPPCDGGGGDGGGGGGPGGVCTGPDCPTFGTTQCYDNKDNDKDGKMNFRGGFLNGKWLDPDPDCSSFKDNSESTFRIREVIPDFFNLNWFKVNLVNFFKAEALAK